MSVRIIGAVSGVDADVGAVSRGQYTELVDASGRKLVPAETYSVAFSLLPTTLTLGTTYFAMRNLGSKVAVIRHIECIMHSTGTAATISQYEFVRFSTATPTAGTAIAVIRGKNSYSATSMSDVRFAPAGLTTAGVVFQGPRWIISHMTQLQSVVWDWNPTMMGEDNGFELDVNEGLAIRANLAVIAGTRLNGSIMWSER